MRIWDQIVPQRLCRKHLLGEHRELHGLWNILVRIEIEGRDPAEVGYSRHPETVRWFGRRAALYNRHESLATEMVSRGYNHASPLAPADAGHQGSAEPPTALDDQEQALRAKECDCT